MIEDILNFFNASKLQLNNVITAFLIEHSPLKLAQISNICTDQIQNIQTDAVLTTIQPKSLLYTLHLNQIH